MDYIANRTKVIDASGIRKIWQLAAGMKDPVNFSIGEPDFGPPEEVKQAAVEAIMAGKNTYTLTTGMADLHNALKTRTSAEFGWDDPAVLVTSGLSGALTLAMMSTINPGDEVLIPDPYFVSYKHLTNMLGGTCVFIDTYPDFHLTPAHCESKISPKSKLLLINSPGNPHGMVYSPEKLKNMADFARKHHLLVISDEIYREFSYERPAHSIAEYYENTIVMRGYSKTFGVPGWRLGYMAAPKHLKNIMEQATNLQQYTFVCAPHPLQAGILKGLDADMSKHIDDYRHKRNMIYEGLHAKFGLIKPNGAFYAFVPAPEGKATEFVTKAIQNNVLIIPGSVFSSRDSHFRISYATSDNNIERGIERLCKLV